MRKDEIRNRFKNKNKGFCLACYQVLFSTAESTEAQVIGGQLLRPGTSVGAHYREAQRSRSNAEFNSKIEGGMQELEETMCWMELLIGAGIVKEQQLEALHSEANEIMAIPVTCTKKVKDRARVC